MAENNSKDLLELEAKPHGDSSASSLGNTISFLTALSLSLFYSFLF